MWWRHRLNLSQSHKIAVLSIWTYHHFKDRNRHFFSKQTNISINTFCPILGLNTKPFSIVYKAEKQKDNDDIEVKITYTVRTLTCENLNECYNYLRLDNEAMKNNVDCLTGRINILSIEWSIKVDGNLEDNFYAAVMSPEVSDSQCTNCTYVIFDYAKLYESNSTSTLGQSESTD